MVKQGLIHEQLQEFLEDTIREIAPTLLKDGFPVNSSHVQNGNFCTCVEMAAASLAQGGPPPCLLDGVPITPFPRKPIRQM